MPTLTLLKDGGAIEYKLADDVTVLGRAPECQIQLDSNMVSRRHAQVTRDKGSFFVEDLSSGNGTFVNGKRINERTLLRSNDRLKLGPLLLRFESGSAPRADAATRDTTAGIEISGEVTATIVDSADNTSGFGLLQVQPEAKLRAVIEIARGLAGTVDLQRIIPLILDTLFTIFPQADRGCILLQDGEPGNMVPVAQKHRKPDADETVKLSRTILNKVLAERTGILSADATSDSRFEAAASISSLTIRSMMCVPMLGLDGVPMGVINLDTQNVLSRFTKDDLDLLLAVAGQAALSYESARLLTSHMEKLKQDSEMAIARNVQHALLPKTLPQAAGYDFFASYDSALAVGGDYYDAILLDDGKVCLSFGDVAGKGVPASLVMSRISSVVRSTLKYVDDVGVAVAAINNHMCSSAVEGRFVTYILAVVDTQAHECQLTIAGHMSPMIRKADGTIEEFDEESVGIPVGVIEDYPYDVLSRPIAPGETVLFYTDGVSEAMNPNGDLYGDKRVREFLRKSTGSAAEIGQALLTDVRAHADGRAQNDDITIMIFSRNA
ncbi:MAG TPA: SpoIIE family protein phosphatase [Planctomycetaceae bacterium]|jgi:serine phosphatase RsbU (regulator of sigma subunit)|nr:SpoIIE family protein phosphatase [Planctomycetaceae bacterium]